MVGVLVYWWYANTPGVWNLALGFAVAESVAHWLIDHGKCQKLYGIHLDQGLHVLCKVAWWGLLAGQWVTT